MADSPQELETDPQAQAPPPPAASPDGVEFEGDSAESIEARRHADRRGQATTRVSRFAFIGGRRRSVRRDQEKEGSFVDLYGFKLWCLVLWVALMNVGDSYFTLVHLQSGGIELNPVAQALLGTGRGSFVLLKSVLIALALLVLAVHKNFYLARVGLWTAAGTYTALVAYHLSLF